MQQVNNFPPINNNINNFQPLARELQGEDNLIIFFNSFPSFIYIIIITIILFLPKNIFFNNISEDDNYSEITHIKSYLIVMLIIYNFYIIKSIFYYYNTVKFQINNSKYLIIISLLNFTLDISYYFSSYSGYVCYQRLSLNFIINNIYICIFIYSLIFIGIVHICLFLLNIFYILLSFIFTLNSFCENEIGFIAQQGELPIIFEQLLKSEKADLKHCKECIICLCDIEEGQDIITLKCSGLHFFHSECIKQWLRQSFSCPICRQQNII